MAQGSQRFAWLQLPGIRKVCRQCGKEPLVIDDVAEFRTVYPGGKTDLLCTECRSANLGEAIARTREGLGLSPS